MLSPVNDTCLNRSLIPTVLPLLPNYWHITDRIGTCWFNGEVFYKWFIKTVNSSGAHAILLTIGEVIKHLKAPLYGPAHYAP